MIECPFCKKECLTKAQYFLSSALFPQTCSNCGVKFGVQGLFSGTTASVFEFLLLGSLYMLFVDSSSKSLWPIILVWSVIDLIIGCLSTPKEMSEKHISEWRGFVGFVGVIFGIAVIYRVARTYL